MSACGRIRIAIDGPVGSGKSTVAKLVAQKLGYRHLDTGAMYRAVALLALRRGVDLHDAHGLGELARSVELSFRMSGGEQRICVDGEDVEDAIRTPEVSRASSLVSAVPEVRDALVKHQRRMAEGGGVVMEGRDIGTVVLPDAEVKAFLTASPEERARRRLLQLQSQGIDAAYEDVLAELIQRDERDLRRSVAPLKAASDAAVIDTDNMTLEDVVGRVVDLVTERCGALSCSSEKKGPA